MKKNIFMLFILTGMAVAASAQTTWKVDAAHSKIAFSVRHMVISDVDGRFTDFDITLENSKDDFTDGKLIAVIKTKSINTDNEGRDKHLRSADFFDAEKYPEIKFVGKSFEKTGKDSYKITGDLTMRDVTKPVVFSMKYNGSLTDPWGNTKAGFKAETVVNRKEFGIVWNKTLEAGGLLVGEDVKVTISAEMKKEKTQVLKP